MSQSTTINPETNLDLLEKFAIRSEPMVQKLVKTMFSEEHEIYVFIQGAGIHFVTEILQLDWDQSVMWLGTPYDKTLAEGCDGQSRYTLVSFPDSVKVQWSGVGMVHTNFQGAEALRISIPQHMVRLQLRNFFRVMADEELNRQVSLSIPGVNGPEYLLDISLAGCGLMLKSAQALEPGTAMSDARLTIPDGEGSMLVDLVVRNLVNVEDDPELFQVGCEMKLHRNSDERRLQRFLLATERRQRAARHSID